MQVKPLERNFEGKALSIHITYKGGQSSDGINQKADMIRGFTVPTDILIYITLEFDYITPSVSYKKHKVVNNSNSLYTPKTPKAYDVFLQAWHDISLLEEFNYIEPKFEGNLDY